MSEIFPIITSHST